MTLQTQIQACRAALQTEAPRIVETMAAAQLALVSQRIQENGLAGAHYTDKSVPRFFFKSKAFNAGGRAYAKSKGKKLGTYAAFKEASGLKSDAVTLTLTGRMFRALTTVYVGASGTVFTAHIVASDQEEAAKVRYNMERYGDFLEPDAAEAELLQEVGKDALQRIIRQYFPQV